MSSYLPQQNGSRIHLDRTRPSESIQRDKKIQSSLPIWPWKRSARPGDTHTERELSLQVLLWFSPRGEEGKGRLPGPRAPAASSTPSLGAGFTTLFSAQCSLATGAGAVYSFNVATEGEFAVQLFELGLGPFAQIVEVKEDLNVHVQ